MFAFGQLQFPHTHTGAASLTLSILPVFETAKHTNGLYLPPCPYSHGTWTSAATANVCSQRTHDTQVTDAKRLEKGNPGQGIPSR